VKNAGTAAAGKGYTAAWAGDTNPPVGVWHSCPVLQSLPVKAAVAASLQQSPDATGMSPWPADACIAIVAAIGHGAGSPRPAAHPCKGMARHSSRARRKRMFGILGG